MVLRQIPAGSECLLSTERHPDVGEALGEADVLIASDMSLVVEEHDLAVHEQTPDMPYLGVGRVCHVDTVNHSPDTRRDRLNCQARVGEDVAAPQDLGVVAA